MHLVKGRKFGLGFCAISLVAGCGSEQRDFGRPVNDAGGNQEPTSGDREAGTPNESNSTSHETTEATSSEPSRTESPRTESPRTESTNDPTSEPTEGSETSGTTSAPSTHPTESLGDGGSSNTVDSSTAPSDAGALDAGDGAVPDACGNLDPDCECIDGTLQGRDVDGDAHLTNACEAAPGDDCDDGDGGFVVNVCGGCSRDLVGTPGDACLDCGILSCTGPDALGCVAPTPAPQRCASSTQVEVCFEGVWTSYGSCSSTYYCSAGQCYSIPSVASSSLVSSASVLSSSTAYAPEAAPERCNNPDSQCVYGSFHPRDASFEIPHGSADRSHESGSRAVQSVLDWSTGLDLG